MRARTRPPVGDATARKCGRPSRRDESARRRVATAASPPTYERPKSTGGVVARHPTAGDRAPAAPRVSPDVVVPVDRFRDGNAAADHFPRTTGAVEPAGLDRRSVQSIVSTAPPTIRALDEWILGACGDVVLPDSKVRACRPHAEPFAGREPWAKPSSSSIASVPCIARMKFPLSTDRRTR